MHIHTRTCLQSTVYKTHDHTTYIPHLLIIIAHSEISQSGVVNTQCTATSVDVLSIQVLATAHNSDSHNITLSVYKFAHTQLNCHKLF